MIPIRRPSRPRLLLAAPVLLILSALSFRSGADEKPATLPAKAALTVSTVKPESADWPQFVAANAAVSTVAGVVGSEIGGLRLTDVLVNGVGDTVKKGQEIARLQSETVAAEREQTRASLGEAEAALAEAQANAARARQIAASGALSAQQVFPVPDRKN